MPAFLKPNVSYNLGAYGHLNTRLRDIKNFSDVDILFLGSSHTYRGFDTRIFAEYGKKTFNLGSSAQTPVQTKLLLNRYLDHLNPKLIVYEVYPTTFTIDGVESSLDIISNDYIDVNTVKMSVKLNNIKTYNTLIYAKVFEFIGINKSFKEARKKGKDTYVSGGYVEKEISFAKPMSFEPNTILLNENQLESFLELVNMIKKKNIDLLLVFAPIPPSNYQAYTNTPYFDSIMSSYARYINFNELISLDDSLHFYDADHLNQNGVSIFNRALIEKL